MTEVELADSAKEILRSYGPEDQKLVARAISLLEDDVAREEGKIDLMLNEGGFRVFAFEVGSVWLQFVEDGGLIKVAHLQARSRFRYG